MRKIVLLTLSAFATVSAFSQAGRVWTPNSENQTLIVKDKAVSRASYPKEFRLFNLDVPSFRQTLLSVTGNNRIKTAAVILLPNADGGIEEFEVVETSNFDPELQARFPEIRAFSGKGITDKYATLKLSISPEGQWFSERKGTMSSLNRIQKIAVCIRCIKHTGKKGNCHGPVQRMTSKCFPVSTQKFPVSRQHWPWAVQQDN